MSKIVYSLEFLDDSQGGIEKPNFLVIGKYDINPQFNIEDKLFLKFEEETMFGTKKKKCFELKITDCKKEIELNGSLLFRYFLQASDKSLNFEKLSELLTQNNGSFEYREV